MQDRLSSADRTLAARLEAAEAKNLTALAKTFAESSPEAAFEQFAGGVAVYAGIGSPMTHAVGIGLNGFVSEDEMIHMEDFFRKRGSPCIIDLCPLADPSVLAFLQSRPYLPIEFNNVLVRRIDPQDCFGSLDGIHRVSAPEIPKWSRMIVEGFSEYMPVTDDAVRTLTATFEESECWSGGEDCAVSGAAMGIQNGIAFFYGDATLPGSRRKGWQSLLIRARLASAQKQNCDLAVVSVLPGSTSHRNYERAGFQLIYMRVNLMRDFAS